MKILHVISSLTSGGAEKLVVDLASAQSKLESNNISVYTFKNSNDLFREKLSPQVNYHNCNSDSFYSIKALFNLYKEIKKNDIIHAHLFHSVYLVAILSKFFPSKTFIMTEHSTWNKRRSKWYFRYLEKFIYNQYDTIICITEATKNLLIKWVGQKKNMVVINNFIDLNQIKNTPPKLLDNSNKKSIVMVGRFWEAKDHKTVLNALLILPETFNLIFIGEGPLKKDIERETQILGLNERVKFLGVRKDVISILKTCHYGVLSSNWEGFGIVALEYMASGLVALGTNVEGLNEVIVIKENLFPVKNYEALANRILTIEKSPIEKKHNLKVQNEFILNYDIHNAVKLHQLLYKKHTY